MNKITLLGRLVKDPDVQYTQSGKCVAKITLAVDRPFSKEKEADFIPVILWDKQAELVGNSCQKGHRLLVEGRLQIRNYDGKDGQKRWVTEVIANSMEFIEKKEQKTSMAGLGEDVPFD